MRNFIIFSVFIFCIMPLAHAMTDINDETMATPTCVTYVEWTGKNIDDIDLSILDDRKYRIIKPGDMVTMDYIHDRLNIEVDDNGNIIKQDCG